MVVFHIKSGDSDSFLYETSAENGNDTIIRELVLIWNLRIRLRQLVGGIRELATYGPMKRPDKAGLDRIEEEFNGLKIEKGEFYNPDPTGLRTGDGPGPQYAEIIEKVAVDTESVLGKEMVDKRLAISVRLLEEKLDNIRGATMIAYPMGLPDWDSVRLTIEGEEGLLGTSAGQEILDPNTAEVWIASRALDRNQILSQRLGKNEKTKVIAKLQKPGGGPPGREPGVTEEERKAMMAYYFKKQEELKKLSENNDDEFLNSAWADPKQLQRALRGQSDIVRGLR